MNKMPPHIVIIVIWVGLLIYLTVDFGAKANVNFVQFNYDWKNIEVLQRVGKMDVDSISHDYISFKNNLQFPNDLDENNTFFLKNDQKTYFRASEILIDNNHIVFSGVKWINHIPDKNTKEGTLEAINLPLIQTEGKTTLTLGDSQIIWREARELRKNLLVKKKLSYVGNKIDPYGYPYEGGTFDTSSEILNKVPNAPSAEYYILFFGAQDKMVDVELLDKNICDILKLLQNKMDTQKVFAINLPPSTNKPYNDYNNHFNARLAQCAAQYKKVQIVDLNHFLIDKKNYLSEDQVHLNDTGYLYLNKLLIQEIP